MTSYNIRTIEIFNIPTILNLTQPSNTTDSSGSSTE
jgi:hypothetical protein